MEFRISPDRHRSALQFKIRITDRSMVEIALSHSEFGRDATRYDLCVRFDEPKEGTNRIGASIIVTKRDHEGNTEFSRTFKNCQISGIRMLKADNRSSGGEQFRNMNLDFVCIADAVIREMDRLAGMDDVPGEALFFLVRSELIRFRMDVYLRAGYRIEMVR